MRKKKAPLGKGEQIFFLFQAVNSVLTTSLLACLGTSHTSLNVVPFHPVTALSRSALCWNIQDPQMNYELTLTGLWQNFQKKTNPYGSPKYQMRTNTCMKRLTYFWHPNWGIQTISMYSGKPPSSMEWLLNPVNKGKYKRNVFVSYLLLSFLRIILFWTFLSKALHWLTNVGVK